MIILIVYFIVWSACMFGMGYGMGGYMVARKWAEAGEQLEKRFREVFGKYNEAS